MCVCVCVCMCVCVCLHIDPTPMMSADPVRVLCPPGQLEKEYKTELKKVRTTPLLVPGPSLSYSVVMYALLQPVMPASSCV